MPQLNLNVICRAIFLPVLIWLAVPVMAQSNTSDQPRSQTFNILDYGAVGDGQKINTEAIQATLDACHTAGGGIVQIPRGEFVTGTVKLKSKTVLSMDHGAVLLGSTELKDYPKEGLRPAREGNSYCLLYAEDADHIRLEGLGTIDGRGFPDHFPVRGGPDGEDQRPRLLRFENCEDVSFSGNTYKNPAFWGFHLVDCRRVHVDGIVVRFDQCHRNNDGLDIDACEDVLIENCDIKAGDDAICLKSTLGVCKDIVVRNCRVSSHTAPLKFGTSSRGGFQDIHVSNCYFYDAPMGGIKLQIVDGGHMENVLIERIVMDSVGSPIFIRLGNRGRAYSGNTKTGPNTGTGKPEGTPAGSIRGIHIKNVTAEVTFDPTRDRHPTASGNKKQKNELSDRERAMAGPIMIAGIPGHCIEDVLLENIRVSYPGQGTEAESKNVPAEDVARYPEQYFFGILPSWGAYIRHARNIEFRNVQMTNRAPDARRRIILDDVEGFKETESESE